MTPGSGVRSYVLTPEPGVEDNTRLQPRSGLNIARELFCWTRWFRPNDGAIFGGHSIADGLRSYSSTRGGAIPKVVITKMFCTGIAYPGLL